MERDEKAWLAVYDLSQRAQGRFVLRYQPCLECGASILTPFSADPPTSCADHGGHEHTYGEPVPRTLYPGDPTWHRYCGCGHFQFTDDPGEGTWFDAAPPRKDTG